MLSYNKILKHLKVLKGILYVFLFIIFLGILSHYGLLHLDYIFLSETYIEEFFNSEGILVDISFFLLLILAVNLPLPLTSILMVLSGALYGVFWGSLMSFVAIVLGISMGFEFFLKFEEKIERFLDLHGKWRVKYEKYFNHRTKIFGVMLLRLSSTISYFLITVLAIFFKLDRKDVILSSLGGVLPSCILFALSGALMSGVGFTEMKYELFFVSFLALLNLIAVGYVMYLQKHEGEEGKVAGD